MAQHNIDGAKAEDKVAEYLKTNGFKVLAKNWKTKWCEIDIVAEKQRVAYFVEVKYRRNSSQGSGFEYITASKLRKMELAAKSWVEINNWKNEYVLSAAEVSGTGFDVEFIEDLII